MTKTVLLALCSLAITVGFAEVVVRRWIPVRNVGPSFTVYDPVYGSRLKRGFSAVRITPEFTMKITTNSRGFRGGEPRDSGERPILVIGDSFTLGYGVDDGREYPALVGRILSPRPGAEQPVINAGIGDAGIGRWIRFLREEGPPLDPRAIVLQVSSNDFQDDLREGSFSIGADGSLVEHNVPRPAGILRRAQALIEIVPWLPYSRLVSLLRELRFTAGARSAPPSGEGLGSNLGSGSDALTLRILESIVELCRSHSWPIVVLGADLPEGRFHKIAALAAGLRVPVVRVPARTERPQLYYRVDGHWNASGHVHAARLTADALVGLLGSSDSALPAAPDRDPGAFP